MKKIIFIIFTILLLLSAFFCKCKPEPPDLSIKDCDISEFTKPHGFNISEYNEGFNILLDIDGNSISPRGKPFQNGDTMITVSDEMFITLLDSTE